MRGEALCPSRLAPAGLWPAAPFNNWRLPPPGAPLRGVPGGGLNGGREGLNAEHADKGDGGGIESLGDKGGDAILLRGLDTEVGHVFSPFQNSAWGYLYSKLPCDARYLAMYFVGQTDLIVAVRYRGSRVAKQ